MKIVLASGSPRRKQLMETTGLAFEIDIPDFDERGVVEKSAHKLAEILAHKKAKSVASRHPDSIVIGSDLVVAYLDKQIGKPQNEQDAKEILQLLRGKTHQVITSVAVVNTGNKKQATAVNISNVTMNNYTDKEIDDYIATSEPMDKGGAYAIQGIGGKLVEKFDGDIETIIGLPTKTLTSLIKKVQ
ncbi:MAG: Maf family protein [bacterium]|nr:Maf family protein [bacterium]